MLQKLIETIKNFFSKLFDNNSSETTIPVLSVLNMSYLKNFRTQQGTEIVIMTADTAMKNSKIAQILKNSNAPAQYIFAEYDPEKDEVLRTEAAEDVAESIKRGIESSANGVLVVQ